jgi:hypothetical protein
MLAPEPRTPPAPEPAAAVPLAAPVAELEALIDRLPPLPRRSGAGRHDGAEGIQAAPPDAPHPEVLRQILDGLRQLR